MDNPVYPFLFRLIPAFAILLAGALLSACAPPQQSILPDKYKRTSLVDSYKSCVAHGTNMRYNPHTPADHIVRKSMASCQLFRNRMVSDYPTRWRENYAKKIDSELYQRELAWVLETRRKEKP
ncbi:MAG: hypothetical protein OEZ68_13710 [Gammaproteobacteria bacterium]|nr:hypothetical protein [Gammaproteobacteria bacterium]MDH5801858.1 hypothetical protein [Gammaproteobacteria bacterium]